MSTFWGTHRRMMHKRKDDIVREYMQLLTAFEAAQANILTYAKHLSECATHRGHDCDCGKDVLIEAAMAWVKTDKLESN